MCLDVSLLKFQLFVFCLADDLHGLQERVTWRRVETEAIGQCRQGSSSIVKWWEHKIEDLPVGRLHQLLISSQLVPSVFA